MNTPWGDSPVSDAHVHFFSHRFYSNLAAQRSVSLEKLGPALGWELPGSDPAELAGTWVQELDRRGVTRAALIASMPGDQDSVQAAVMLYPDRFFGYAMVNAAAPDGVAQTAAALAGGLIRGICLFPAMHRYSMHDDRVSLVLEAAAAHPRTVVFVHCGALRVGFRNKLGLPCPFDMRYSNPIDLHETALRFPQLRFVIPHFGAGYFREALMVCDLCPNVFLDTSSSNSWMRYEEADVDLRKVFRRVLDVLGPQRVLFGTDSSWFPRGWNAEVFEAQSKALYEIGADAPTARLILHDNLQNLFA